jgi:CBS domain-containing protein
MSSTDLVTVEPSTMMTEAAAAMSSARVGSSRVEEALVGIFTERDILGLRAVPCRPGPGVPVSGATPQPSDDGPDATVGEAMDKMLDGSTSPGHGRPGAGGHRLHTRPRAKHLEGLNPWGRPSLEGLADDWIPSRPQQSHR